MVVVPTTPAPAYQRPGTTERVSVASNGAEANINPFVSSSITPAVSGNGRYVAFTSPASNLVPGDTNDANDVFVRDRAMGTTERVSISVTGAEAKPGSFDPFWLVPAISADGRYVAFASPAPNLVAGDGNGAFDVFVRDRFAATTERISVTSAGAEAKADPFNSSATAQAISADGRYVAFTSPASNLVPGDGNGAYDVFVRDRVAGTTERVSVASDGTEANSSSSTSAAISADGRYVAFTTPASNLVPGDNNNSPDVFVRDRVAGTTERVSVSYNDAEADFNSATPSISADGRYVAFASSAANLIPGDGVATTDIFVRDRVAGTTERVSVGSDGSVANSSSSTPAISADGRYVAFVSGASNLVSGDTNGTRDVFVHDRIAGTTQRASVSFGGAEGNSNSSTPAISGDGRHVAFVSPASNLVPGDANGADDAFVRDLGPRTGPWSLRINKASGQLVVSGWAAFSGASITTSEDPPADGAPGAGDAGAEIVAASIIYRPESEDLLLRLRLASLPGPVVGGAPGVLYRWALSTGATNYEVRALRGGASPPPVAAPYFALYRCAPTCTEVVRLSGSIGSTGSEVAVSLPVGALGINEGSELRDVRASTAIGDAVTGSLSLLDEVSLPETAVPVARVQLGIASFSVPGDGVAYTTPTGLFNGEFSGILKVSTLPADTYRVWAKACLGDACGVDSLSVKL